jgi:hypothetical protein
MSENAATFSHALLFAAENRSARLRRQRTLNCDQLQGFFHCQPVRVHEIDKLLAQDQ